MLIGLHSAGPVSYTHLDVYKRQDSYFAGNCSSTYIDLPLLLQYHFNKEWKNGIVAECGPVVSFLAKGGKYGGRTEDNVVNGEKEYRNFDLGLQPALYYETKSWRFGVQAHVGLLDTKCKYLSLIHIYAQPSITRQDIGASACSPMSGSLTSSANFPIDPTPRFSTTNTMP